MERLLKALASVEAAERRFAPVWLFAAIALCIAAVVAWWVEGSDKGLAELSIACGVIHLGFAARRLSS